MEFWETVLVIEVILKKKVFEKATVSPISKFQKMSLLTAVEASSQFVARERNGIRRPMTDNRSVRKIISRQKILVRFCVVGQS